MINISIQSLHEIGLCQQSNSTISKCVTQSTGVFTRVTTPNYCLVPIKIEWNLHAFAKVNSQWDSQNWLKHLGVSEGGGGEIVLLWVSG